MTGRERAVKAMNFERTDRLPIMANGVSAGFVQRLLRLSEEDYWDDEPSPSVETPMGAFFGQGHGKPCSFDSLCVSVGDDMIFIDGEKWPPSLHGTGMEDYFCHAWGMKERQSYARFGAPLFEVFRIPMGNENTAYRWHIEDAVTFTKSL